MGSSEAETRAEAAAVEVATGLRRLQGGEGAEDAEASGESVGRSEDGGKEGFGS